MAVAAERAVIGRPVSRSRLRDLGERDRVGERRPALGDGARAVPIEPAQVGRQIAELLGRRLRPRHERARLPDHFGDFRGAQRSQRAVQGLELEVVVALVLDEAAQAAPVAQPDRGGCEAGRDLGVGLAQRALDLGDGAPGADVRQVGAADAAAPARAVARAAGSLAEEECLAGLDVSGRRVLARRRRERPDEGDQRVELGARKRDAGHAAGRDAARDQLAERRGGALAHGFRNQDVRSALSPSAVAAVARGAAGLEALLPGFGRGLRRGVSMEVARGAERDHQDGGRDPHRKSGQSSSPW